MKNTESIYSTFIRQVEAHPDAPAVIDGNDGGRVFSYKDLAMLAAAIRDEFPTKQPVRVGIMMNHVAAQIAAMIAVLGAGAAYVPVEPSFPIERTAYIMRQSQVDFILTEKGRRLPAALKGIAAVRISPNLKPVSLENRADLEGRHTPADKEAYVLYTSGTSGRPKGVRVTNGNVVNYARAFENEFHTGPGDVMLQYSVCTFDIFTEEVWTSLLNGAAIAIPSPEVRADLRALMQFVEQNEVTIISGFPYLLLEINKLPSLPKSLRLLISGGDVLRASYVDKLVDRIPVYNTYGPSETTVCASYYNCSEGTPLADGTYPIGHPVLGAEVFVDDGEICIRGKGVSLGYVGEPPEQANFITEADGGRMYRSGDLGYVLPDGNLAFIRRKDTQVMIEGKRVECDEVENVLCHCRGVESAVVCPYTDSRGLSYLVAYIVPRVKGFSLHKVKRSLRRLLTPFMIPEYFVAMQHMPMTPNGKVDRKALPVILKEIDDD